VKYYLRVLGGAHPILFFTGYILFYCIEEAADIAQLWFLGALVFDILFRGLPRSHTLS